MPLGKDVHDDGPVAEAHPGERPRGVMGEVPVTDAVVSLTQLEAQRAVGVRAGQQRQRFVQPVAETGVDVPPPARVGIGGQVMDDEHEVVRERLDVRSGCAVDATDVARYPSTLSTSDSAPLSW